MTLRGRITRLPFSTGNTNLPVLISYDTSDILADILAWPSLRAFFDFTNPETMTQSGGLVVSVEDLTGTYTATAAVGDRAVYNPSAYHGQPGLTFAGAEKYAVPGLWSGSAKIGVAAAVMSTAGDNTSRMIVCDADWATRNFYCAADVVRHMNNAFNLLVPSFRGRMVNVIWGLDADANTGTIHADGLSASGTIPTDPPTDDGNIGAWHDAIGNKNNNFVGSMGYVAVFEEDLGQNATLRGLLEEFTLRRWRLA